MERTVLIAFGLVTAALFRHETALKKAVKRLDEQQLYLYQKSIDENFAIIAKYFNED